MDVDNNNSFKCITMQAHIFMYAGLIASITIFIMVPELWLLGITIIIGSFIGAYSINCMINGDCKLWAWSVLIVNISYMMIFLMMILTNKKDFIKKLKNNK